MTAFVLVHSPLVGPSTWVAVAHCLLAAGHDAVVPDLRHAARADDPLGYAAEVVADASEQLDGPGPVVLVAHSNAGLLAPVLVEPLAARGHPVAGAVLVDAGLPGPAGTRSQLAPERLLVTLEPLVDAEGYLPPWSRWWGPGVLEQELPSAAAREALRAEEPSVPISYLRGSVPVPAGWDDVALAYLRLTAGYDAEARRARDLGLPVRLLDAGHLHPVVDPVAVADVVSDLARRLTG